MADSIKLPFLSGNPWWSKGVEFTCLPNCGRCCDEPGGIVYLSEEDATRIAEHFSLPMREWMERDCRTTYDGRFVLESKIEDGRCIYLDGEKACTIYEVKPAQCSAFPFWRENMINARSWEKTKANCPGIGHEDAKTVTKETIEAHLKADLHAEQGFRLIPLR